MNTLLAIFIAASFVGNVSSWKIEKRKDSMTDEISCGASIRGRSEVWLTDNVLYIYIGRTPKGITLRFGDEPAQQSVISPAEKSVRSIMIGKFDLDQIVDRKIIRIRYRVITILDTLVEGDIDITGIDKVLEIIRGDNCRS